MNFWAAGKHGNDTAVVIEETYSPVAHFHESGKMGYDLIRLLAYSFWKYGEYLPLITLCSHVHLMPRSRQ